MNSLLSPAFIFDPYDPGTSLGFLLVLRLPDRPAGWRHLQALSLDLLTGGRADGCLAVLLVGGSELSSGEQARLVDMLSRRWKVAVEVVGSLAAARRFGAWMLGEFHRLFEDCCEEAASTLQLACLRQMSLDFMEEFDPQQVEVPMLAA